MIKAKDMTKEGFAAADASGAKMAEGIKKAGMIAGAALVAVGVESVRMAAKFDSATTQLNTQAGVSKAKMDVLRQGILQLAGQVGFDPDSLAEAAYHVASNMQSLGASAPKMLQAVKIAAEGARVGGADLVDVTNALTAAIASGIPGVQNYQKAMGILNATVGSGDMKMQDLADAFGTGMLATVKQFGVSIKDVGAALAVFGDNNIRGAKAGTDLRMAVQALASPAITGADALKKMNLGYSTLARDMQKGGLKLAMEDLVSHMHKAGITGAKVGAILTTAFGKKAGTGINILADQMGRFESKFPDMEKGANKFGSAWKTTQQTFSQQMHEIGGSLDALMITIGNKLLPVVQSFVQLLLRHKQVAVDVAAAIGILAGVLLTAATVIKTVEIAIKLWTAAQWLLNAALTANPIGVLIMAIAGVVAILVIAYTKSKTFRDIVHKAMHDVAVAFGAVRHAAAVAFLAVVHAMEGAWNWASTHWKLILGILTGPIGAATIWIVDHWHQIVAGAQDMYHSVINFFTSLPGRILSAVGDLGSLLFDAGKAVIQGLINGIESMIGGIGHAIGGIVGEIRNFLPFSPAKKGPLSGAGSPDRAGRKIAAMLAQGMAAGSSSVAAAGAGMAGAAMAGMHAPGGAGGPGGGTLRLEIAAASGDPFITWLAQQLRNHARVKYAGSAQRAYGYGTG